jgi:hypothetical protein
MKGACDCKGLNSHEQGCQQVQTCLSQAANIIFLESPAFVGWSFSNDTDDLIVGKFRMHSIFSLEYFMKYQLSANVIRQALLG